MIDAEALLKILKAAPIHLRVGIVLLVESGGRTYSEGFPLRRDQVDHVNKVIRLHNNVKTEASAEDDLVPHLLGPETARELCPHRRTVARWRQDLAASRTSGVHIRVKLGAALAGQLGAEGEVACRCIVVIGVKRFLSCAILSQAGHAVTMASPCDAVTHCSLPE